MSKKTNKNRLLYNNITINHSQYINEIIINYLPDLFQKKNSIDIKKEIDKLYNYLEEAIFFDDQGIFIDYALWLKRYLFNNGYQEKEIYSIFAAFKKLFADKTGSEDFKQLEYLIDQSVEHLKKSTNTIKSFISEENINSQYARKYLELLLAYKKNQAVDYILNTVKEEISLQEVYIDVFQIVQWEIGRLWHLNQISVGMEHYCSSVTQLIISQLYLEILNSASTKTKVLTTAVGSELHEIGIRMVADLLELDGFDTIHLGANTPNKAIIDTIKTEYIFLIGISVTMPIYLKNLEILIKELRHEFADKIKIVLGGYVFNLNPGLWKKFSADAYGANAEEAVKKMNLLYRGLQDE